MVKFEGESPTLYETPKKENIPTFSIQSVSIEANLRMVNKKKSLLNANGLPYIEARLVDCGGDLSKRWYIVYYIFDVVLNELVRVRDYQINKKDTITGRKNWAKALVQMYNYELYKGWVRGKEVKTEPKKILSITEAIDLAVTHLNLTGRQASIHTFNSFQKLFREYMAKTPIKNINAKEYNQKHFIDFLAHQKKERAISNRTYNNYISIFKLFFNTLKKQGYIENNPIEGLKMVRADGGRHTVFNEEQKRAIMELSKKEYPQLHVFIYFMYHAFIRPKELTLLKVNQIQKDLIMIGSDVSKNRMTEYIPILPPLKRVIDQLNIFHLPGEFYLFGTYGTPGTRCHAITYFTKQHLLVLRQLGLGSGYTLYSWKHTGNVDLYRATKDIMLVNSMNRHHSLDMTKKYLKDLGVFEDYRQYKDLPDLQI